MFEQAEEIAHYIATERIDEGREKIVRRMEVALRWFTEGCRADENLMAVTYFAAALDTLSGGRGNTHPILTMLKSRIGLDESALLSVDGMTTRQTVERIYSTARSQFLHGSTDAHLADWTELRAYAEKLSRDAMVACLAAARSDAQLVDFTK